MPRGSKPGERRGGRQKGTPNKGTALERAVIVATLDNARLSPLELNLALMRNHSLPLERQVKAAREALPYVHAKLRRTTAKRSSKKRKNDKNDDGGSGRVDADSSAKGSIGARVKTRRLAIAGEPKDADITPLRFLQQVLWDQKAPAQLRAKVASMITPYVHYTPSGQPGEAEQIADSGRARAMVIEDQFGFDAELIMDMRMDELNLRRLQKARVATGKASSEELKLIERIRKRQSLLCCPGDYTAEEMQQDLERRREMIAKTTSKKANSRLTAEEKAELLHISGRIDIFFHGRRPNNRQPPAMREKLAREACDGEVANPAGEADKETERADFIG